MIKVVEIISAKNFQLVCKFNTQEIKTIAIKPLLDNQKHLNGIERRYKNNIFEKAPIASIIEITNGKNFYFQKKIEIELP